MDARPLLVEVARALRLAKLEAVLIGNAAAALRGVPLTTLDLDFLFRKSPGSVTKLRKVADVLSATVMRPLYPISDLYRIVRDEGDMIRRWQALPPEKRTHFLPRRVGLRASAR